jgi:hypothetical protein
MARLYSNENFPRRVVEELRRLGHDVLISFEAGRAAGACRHAILLARNDDVFFLPCMKRKPSEWPD